MNTLCNRAAEGLVDLTRDDIPYAPSSAAGTVRTVEPIFEFFDDDEYDDDYFPFQSEDEYCDSDGPDSEINEVSPSLFMQGGRSSEAVCLDEAVSGPSVPREAPTALIYCNICDKFHDTRGVLSNRNTCPSISCSSMNPSERSSQSAESDNCSSSTVINVLTDSVNTQSTPMGEPGETIFLLLHERLT